jgi:hypothetical protein
LLLRLLHLGLSSLHVNSNRVQDIFQIKPCTRRFNSFQRT